MPGATHAVSVVVEFMGPFDFDFGKTSVALSLAAPATIRSLVDALASRWPGSDHLCRLVHGGSERSRYCVVFVDHVMLPPDGVLDAAIRDGARVCFAMPMVGG